MESVATVLVYFCIVALSIMGGLMRSQLRDQRIRIMELEREIRECHAEREKQARKMDQMQREIDSLRKELKEHEQHEDEASTRK